MGITIYWNPAHHHSRGKVRLHFWQSLVWVQGSVFDALEGPLDERVAGSLRVQGFTVIAIFISEWEEPYQCATMQEYTHKLCLLSARWKMPLCGW